MANVSSMAIDVNDPRRSIDENDVINGGNVIYGLAYPGPRGA